MINENIPKVLILSRAFDAGDAITTLNLFSKWPKEKLFCASPIQSSFILYFQEYYFFGDLELKPRFPFSLFDKLPKSTIIPTISNGEQKNTFPKIISLKRLLYKKYFLPILRYLDLYEERFAFHLSESFRIWINQIKPDVIYTSIGDISFAKFLDEFVDSFPDIKVVTHGFDDWTTPSYSIINRKNHCKKAEELMKSLFVKSDMLLTSSEKMAQEYNKNYSRNFITFHNPVDLINILQTRKETQKKRKQLTYIGKVSTHNAKAILDMIKAVEHYNSTYSEKIIFAIYTQSTNDVLDSFNIKGDAYTFIYPPIVNSAVAELLVNSNILYLPITITEEVKRFTRHSMSTKIGEYLASGRPIIYCGPEDIAMTEFFKEKKCGICITTPGILPLEDGLKYIMTHPVEVEEWKKKGQEIADKHFNKETISNRFLKCIQSLFNY